MLVYGVLETEYLLGPTHIDSCRAEPTFYQHEINIHICPHFLTLILQKCLKSLLVDWKTKIRLSCTFNNTITGGQVMK